MKQKWVPVALVVLSVLVGLVIKFSLNQEYEYHGVVYQDSQPAPPIDLASAKGDFLLSEQTGKVVLIFFGYASCPDICPSTLSDMKRVVASLNSYEEDVLVAFVTVDPDRDSIEKLGEYVALFNQDFIGLSGTEEALASIWNNYGVVREIDDSSESMAGYLVNHTSRIYLIDPHGRLYITYGFGTPPENISEDIQHILDEASALRQ